MDLGMYTQEHRRNGTDSCYVRIAEMSWKNWVEEIEQKLNGRRVNVRPKSWLYREAYYDDYNIDDAMSIALDPNQEFKMVKVGWMGPK